MKKKRYPQTPPNREAELQARCPWRCTRWPRAEPWGGAPSPTSLPPSGAHSPGSTSPGSWGCLGASRCTRSPSGCLWRTCLGHWATPGSSRYQMGWRGAEARLSSMAGGHWTTDRTRGLETEAWGGDRHSGGTPGPRSEAAWKRLRYPLPQGSLARWGGALIGPLDWRPFEKLSRAVADTQSCRILGKPRHCCPQVPPGSGGSCDSPGGVCRPAGEAPEATLQPGPCLSLERPGLGRPSLPHGHLHAVCSTCTLSAASARWPSSQRLEPSPATRACGPGALPGRPPACPGQLWASGTPRSLDLPDLGLQGHPLT